MVWIREAQKHADPADPDPQHDQNKQAVDLGGGVLKELAVRVDLQLALAGYISLPQRLRGRLQ
jgi:hypothetical protein